MHLPSRFCSVTMRDLELLTMSILEYTLLQITHLLYSLTLYYLLFDSYVLNLQQVMQILINDFFSSRTVPEVVLSQCVV